MEPPLLTSESVRKGEGRKDVNLKITRVRRLIAFVTVASFPLSAAPVQRPSLGRVLVRPVLAEESFQETSTRVHC
jgi:hypothetical protein